MRKNESNKKDDAENSKTKEDNKGIYIFEAFLSILEFIFELFTD